MSTTETKERIALDPAHPSFVQTAIYARYVSLKETRDALKKQLGGLSEAKLEASLDYLNQLKDETNALLRAYETYTGATWLDVQRFFGLTKKDES